MGKMAQKWVEIGFGAIFSYFSAIFSYFPGEAETYIFPFFSRPKWGLYQANKIPITVKVEIKSKLIPKQF